MLDIIQNFVSKNFINIIFAVLVILLMSCSDNGTAPQTNPPKNLIPLGVGYFWSYEHIGYEPDSQAEIYFDTLITSIKNTYTDKNGGTWYSFTDGDSILAANMSDGFRELVKKDSNNYDGSIKFKYPALQNDVFTYIDFSLIDTFKVTVQYTDIIVSVKTGSFDCYKYEAVSDRNKVDYYICPGIGIIKYITYFKPSGSEVYIRSNSYELIGYKIK